MPPHFYITADKSTNRRITNQVTVICPVPLWMVCEKE
jgi:hypothetical protein